MSNSHAQLAQERIAGVHEWQAYEGSTDATNIAAAIDALLEATLAVAYEQRTANLIAALQPVQILGKKEWKCEEATALRMRDEISERLYPRDSK